MKLDSGSIKGYYPAIHRHNWKDQVAMLTTVFMMKYFGYQILFVAQDRLSSHAFQVDKYKMLDEFGSFMFSFAACFLLYKLI